MLVVHSEAKTSSRISWSQNLYGISDGMNKIKYILRGLQKNMRTLSVASLKFGEHDVRVNESKLLVLKDLRKSGKHLKT